MAGGYGVFQVLGGMGLLRGRIFLKWDLKPIWSTNKGGKYLLLG